MRRPSASPTTLHARMQTRPLHVIVERFGQLSDRFDVILVIGSDYTDVATGTELSFNAKIAANLGSPVVLVVHGRERTPEQIRAAAEQRDRRTAGKPCADRRSDRQPC